MAKRLEPQIMEPLTDDEFEAYLLELLSDFQVSVPELGTIRATSRPLVVLTSNGTRELSDALRRRCLYHYVDYPAFDKELRIVNARVPEIGPQLARQVVAFVQDLRRLDLRKKPGIAETLDWAAALFRLDVSRLDAEPETIDLPAGTQPETVYRLNRKGMPHLRRRGRGDMLVHIGVVIPTDLTDEQSEVLRSYGELRAEQPAERKRGLFRR